MRTHESGRASAETAAGRCTMGAKEAFSTDNWQLTTDNSAMTDPRLKKLARLLTEYSTALKRGDRVLLDLIDVPDEFSVELILSARGIGANRPVEVSPTRVSRQMVR